MIEWFTVAAQIVNFLILVVLLKRFLYRPILDAMEKRRQAVESELKNADARREEAEKEKQTFRQKQQELETAREAKINEAKQKADEERKALVAQARKDVETMRAEWTQSVEREKEDFVSDLKRQLAQRAVDVSRKALSDLADADLEAQVTAAFLRQVKSLDDSGRRALLDRVTEKASPCRVLTSFELSEDSRKGLAEGLNEALGTPLEFAFETSDELVCGIELRTDGHSVAWSVEKFLEDLEGRLLHDIEDIGEKEPEKDDTEADRE